MGDRLPDYFHTDFGNKVLMLTYALHVVLFLDIAVSLRTAIVTPHGIVSILVVTV